MTRDYEAIKRSTQIWAEKRKFFVEYFPKNAIGVEVGVHYGQFSRYILDIAKPKLLYLVDPWLQDDNRTKENRTREQIENIYLEVKHMFFSCSNVRIERMTSRNFFWNFTNGEIDYVYIDGCHEYECVYDDLVDSWEIVKPGGLITGDDYIPNKHFGDNITRAVVDFCNEKQVEHKVFKIPGYSSQFLIEVR